MKTEVRGCRKFSQDLLLKGCLTKGQSQGATGCWKQISWISSSRSESDRCLVVSVQC